MSATINIIEDGPRAAAVQKHGGSADRTGISALPATVDEPTFADIKELAKSADQLGDIYKEATARLPSNSEKRAAIARETAEFLGKLADDVVAEGAELQPAAVCPHCQRDYTASCPEGWRANAAPGACAAPASYDGPCAPLEYFGGEPAGGRAEIEARCSVCWPCRD